MIIKQSTLFLLAILSIGSVHCIDEWSNDKEVQTVYYQGMFSSQTQAAKYAPELKTTTNEILKCSKGINVIQNPWVTPEIDEVTPQQKIKTWGDVLNPLRWATLAVFQGSRLANKFYGFSIDKENESETIMGHSVDIRKINVGQDGDIANHKKRWDACLEQYKSNEKILFGVSRGAATTFNSHAQNNYPNVKLVVLEGCFDSVANVLKERCPRILQFFGFHRLVHWIVEKCTSHKRDGIAPIDNVEKFPADVPVAFITSQKDKEVPMQCTKNIARALAQARINIDNAKPVYLLTLKNSSHPCYPTANEDDKKLYQQFMHQIYKDNNLPYIEQFADSTINLENYKIK